MSETYGELKLRVPDDEDEATGADVPASFREYTDSLGDTFTAPKGQLLIAQDGDISKFVAMKGDATLAADGTLTLANNQRLFVAETSRTNVADGSFATPLRIVIPQVRKHQVVYVSLDFYAKNSKVNLIGGAVGGQLRLLFNGIEEAPFQGLWSLSESSNELPAETWAHVVSVSIPFKPGVAGEPGPFTWNRDAYGLPGGAPAKQVPIYWSPFPWRVSADTTNYAVEVIGRSSNGTISVGQFAMNVWVVG